jgi:circadian clock protein KaiB
MKKTSKKKRPNSKIAFERALKKARDKHYLLNLYITGSTFRSMRAIANIKQLCEEHLKGRYQLDVFDIYQDPKLAKEADIFAAPTLVKKLPLPLRKLIGDMGNSERILEGLDVKKTKK